MLRRDRRATIFQDVFDSLLFIGGRAVGRTELLDRLISSQIAIAAADSGFDAAMEIGAKPNLICGDMDSMADRNRISSAEQAERIELDRDKDETDTEIGLRLLNERGYRETLVCGGGGSERFDHELGILWTFFRQTPPRGWLQPENELLHVRSGEEIHLMLEPGTIVSCFPADPGRVYSFRSKGLKWPLQGLEWNATTVGISNEIAEESVTITVEAGGLLLARPDRVDGRENGLSLLERVWQQ